MRFLTLFLVFTSCTISYYYKGKDLHKAHNKSNKEVSKFISEFNKIDEFKRMFAQVETSKLSPQVKSEFNQSVKNCVKYRHQIQKVQKQRNAYFDRLKINKKKKYVKKDKNYKEVQKFADSFKPYSKLLEGIGEKAKEDCEEPNKLIKKHDIKILSANDLYQKFNKHKNELNSTVGKIKKKKSEFKTKVQKSRHKNKNKILKKVGEMGTILREINGQVKTIDSEITSLKKQYGAIKKLVVARGTKAYAATKKLEQNIGKYNGILRRFEKTTKEINELSR